MIKLGLLCLIWISEELWTGRADKKCLIKIMVYIKFILQPSENREYILTLNGYYR